jgi:hypothetical protein
MEQVMNRCQLQYLHPQQLEWVDCAQKVTAGTEVLVDDTPRAVCSEHRDQVRQVKQAGLTSRLRWSQTPTPPRRPSRVAPGQQRLLEVPAVKRKVR